MQRVDYDEIAHKYEGVKMAQHKVTFELPVRELGTSDVKFRIKRDDEMFGTLEISKGSVVWFPKGTLIGYKMGWKKFNELMEAQATKFEKR